MNSISDMNWKAEALLIAGLFVMVPYRAFGQPGSVENPSNMECLEHLEIPHYPPLARSGRFQATLTVKVLLSNQSTIQNIESSVQAKTIGIEKFFMPDVEKAIKISRFAKTCGGKTVTLVFHYELSNEESMAFEPPNHFLIRSGAVTVNPEVSGK